MEQIVYVSTSRSLPDERLLDGILAVSRRNNARDGLTGLLVVGGRRFLQVLEGPCDLCDAAYARIRADERHFALVQLSRRPLIERSFAGWHMGFEQGYANPLVSVVEQLTDRVADPYLQAQFRSFAELHSQPA
ncbi:BLUF domain-containing protein [Sphingomonas sp. LHG3406-1]|uniref:BLUF domain-containing protein n=1 Tax=Sphingomonas sp. LHG3406-1 TaxID=2804617 RepID=UPI00261333D0|nr:BLUF domain-containing protein [Sphingomonas sp. LHG3406-1]